MDTPDSVRLIPVQRHVSYSFSPKTAMLHKFRLLLKNSKMWRSLYNYTIKVLLVSPLEYWGIAAISTTPPRPRLLEAFFKRRLE